MSTSPKKDRARSPESPAGRNGEALPPYDAEVESAQAFQYSESRKLGVTGSVFLILNKMIGTGSAFSPVFAHPPSLCLPTSVWDSLLDAF